MKILLLNRKKLLSLHQEKEIKRINKTNLQTYKTNKTMKDLKGTKTEKNLWEAFAGESQARNKYTYFLPAAAPANSFHPK